MGKQSFLGPFSVANERGGGAGLSRPLFSVPLGLEPLRLRRGRTVPGGALARGATEEAASGLWRGDPGDTELEPCWPGEQPEARGNGPGASTGSPAGGGASGPGPSPAGPPLSEFSRPVGLWEPT